MQHAVAVAQPGDAAVVEQVRVDPRRLRRDVGPDAHGTAGKLVGDLERAQLEILPGAGQQGLEIFQHRRHDELETVTAKMIEYAAAQALDALGLGRQCVGDVFGQQPVHENTMIMTRPMIIEVRPMKRIWPSVS